jgi:hypothetical protein
MATRDQNIGCTQGDDFTFAITILPYPDGTVPDLAGASARWALMEGNFTGAAVLIDKTASGEIFINTDDEGNWQVVVELDSANTQNIPRGMYYHQCVVTLAGGLKSHIEGGAFLLGFSAIP